MQYVTLFGQLIWFFLSAGIANMAPVLFRNHFQVLNKPVDGGKTISGEPVFGSHKTWRGLVVATVVGGLVYGAQYAAGIAVPSMVNWFPFDIYQYSWTLGFAFGAAAILGDLIKSFIKRRLKVAPGKPWFPFDQIDSIVAAALLATFLFPFTLVMWVMSVVVWPLLHMLANHIGYWIGMKDTKW